jgi:hypothetical protein
VWIHEWGNHTPGCRNTNAIGMTRGAFKLVYRDEL